MHFRQKKLTLNTPYNSITQTLWQQKKINKDKEQQNKQLRTQLYQLAQSHCRSNNHSCNKLEEKYNRLSQKHKGQQQWIKVTTNLIEQRNYEHLVEQVKKAQNRLMNVTKKTLKMEKRVKSVYLKTKKKMQNDNYLKVIQQKQIDPIEQLEQDRVKLQQEYQTMSTQVQTLHQRNQQLNTQLIQLLKIKNALRQHKRSQQGSRSISPKASI